MAGFWNLKGVGASALCLFLWAFLLPFENAQYLHEFQELSIHGPTTDAPASRVADPTQRGHDCHRCLVSHPKTFAGLTLDRSADSSLRAEQACRLPNVKLVPFIERTSPNKRSPPV